MFDHGSVHSEPECGSFESCYLTWYDGSYGDGELLPFNQDRLYEDNSFSGNEEEEDNHFSRNTLYGRELLFPLNGWMNNWLAEFESYVTGGWGDDAVPSYVNCPEKSDDLFAGEDDDNNYHVIQESEAVSADSWDEMRLVESIFGYWPSLLKLDLEDRTEPAVA
ncbi:hypothetical protein HAX54_018244 [Datura stramonium]|uniref:Uncharacterized protein n=1 Tax=Datura stramonium TaxID=4076 RepID=A0ABS8S1V0_DATST|nr:hypothetical protein [Datura stramonium]